MADFKDPSKQGAKPKARQLPAAEERDARRRAERARMRFDQEQLAPPVSPREHPVPEGQPTDAPPLPARERGQ